MRKGRITVLVFEFGKALRRSVCRSVSTKLQLKGIYRTGAGLLIKISN